MRRRPNDERWGDWISSAIARLADGDLLREPVAHEPDDALHVRAGGRRLTLFCSNDYLGLSSDPEVTAAASEIVQRYGNGPRGSPLVCGYTALHAALEDEIAALKETESALLFPTGFAANLSVLASLAGKGTAIFSDELNHASIIDGCRMARRNGAELRVYRHADVDHLRELVSASDSPRKLIVTDSAFSMDGDFAPLAEIVELACEHEALTMIDEAHATLVHGPSGAGYAEEVGVAAEIDVHVGTLSKAFGAQGGFVATTEELRTLLLNRGRPYVFSTALPLPVVASARAALKRASSGELRARLFRHVDRVASALSVDARGPIVPVIIGSERAALDAAATLHSEGLVVPAIRPPTVPQDTSRLRVTLSAAHTDEEVDDLCRVLSEIGRR